MDIAAERQSDYRGFNPTTSLYKFKSILGKGSRASKAFL